MTTPVSLRLILLPYRKVRRLPCNESSTLHYTLRTASEVPLLSLLASAMALNLATKLGITLPKSANGLANTFRRTYISPSISIRSSRAIKTPPLSLAILQQSFRRSYADTISPATKRRGRGFIRWTWRLTYLSAIGGIGWLGYNIYVLRTPQEQFDPDPSKKTLVILGMFTLWYSMAEVDLAKVLVGVQFPS